VVLTDGGRGAGKLQRTLQPTLPRAFVVSLPTERVLVGAHHSDQSETVNGEGVTPRP